MPRNPTDPAQPDVREDPQPDEVPGPPPADASTVARDAAQQGDGGSDQPRQGDGGGDQGGARTVQTTQPSEKDVTVTLAHPMDAYRAKRLGLDTEDTLPPGTQVRLHRNYARGLITAGVTNVDPENAQAVREALAVEKS